MSLTSVLAALQTPVPVPQTGSIRGVVTDSATGRPVPGVTVTLSLPASAAAPAIPGIPALPPTAVNFSLTQITSISGRVVDAVSKPVVGAFVQAIVRTTAGGREHNFGGPNAKTDAEGRYEITRLAAGSYFVMLLSTQHTRSDTTPAARVIPPLFFPNATRISGATRMILADNRARTDIDFTQQPVVTQKVSGRLVGSTESYAGLVLRLMADDLTDIGSSADVATTLVNGDGTFTFLNVPHGDYVLIKIIPGTSPLLVATYLRDLAHISAVIRSDKHEPAPGAQLLVFSVDETLWADFGYRPQWIFAPKANAAGKASSALLPGDYYIAAVPADRVLSWPDVDLLPLAKTQAARMKIEGGQPVTFHVKVMSTIR